MKEKNEIVLYHIGEETNWKYLFLHPHQFTIR